MLGDTPYSLRSNPQSGMFDGSPPMPYNLCKYCGTAYRADCAVCSYEKLMKERRMALPTDAKERKDVPVATGFVDYFPDAMVAVAGLSRVGNDQHNPGKPLHWDRSKSGDEQTRLCATLSSGALWIQMEYDIVPR